MTRNSPLSGLSCHVVYLPISQKPRTTVHGKYYMTEKKRDQSCVKSGTIFAILFLDRFLTLNAEERTLLKL